MTTVPAIKGYLGDKLYYQCTMHAKDLIARTEPVEEHFSKEDMKERGERGKLQRLLNKRYLTDVAPYLLRNKDRFIPSIVVNLDPKLCEFSPLENVSVPIDGKLHRVKDYIQFDYRDQAANIGFLHIKDTDSMFILDGQHRMAAYRAAINAGPAERKVLEKKLEETDEVHLLDDTSHLKGDQISVLFVSLKNTVEMRKLFTDVNSNARSISQDERIAMDERDGRYKIVQNIIDDNLVFNHTDWILPRGVNLQPTSLKFIPKKTLTTIVENICKANDVQWPKNIMPQKGDLEKVQTICVSFLKELFSSVDCYKKVLSQSPDDNVAPKYRNRDNTYALIMKPLPMIALAEAVLLLKAHSDLDTKQIYRIINNIDWSYKDNTDHQFLGSVINIEGNIQTGTGVKDRLRDLMIYWILGSSKAAIFFESSNRLETLTSEWNRSTRREGEIPEVVTK